MRKIFVPTDFSEAAYVALKYAIGYAQHYDAGLYIHHTFEMPPIGFMPSESMMNLVAKAEEEASDRLNRLIAKLKEDTAFSGEIGGSVSGGSVIESICRGSVDQSCDLIIMGTTGASGIEEKVLGSVAYNVAKESSLPVLVVPQNAVWSAPKIAVMATDLSDARMEVMKKARAFAVAQDIKLVVIYVNQFSEEFFKVTADEKIESLRNNPDFEGVSFQVVDFPDIVLGINDYIIGLQAQWLMISTHKSSFFESLFRESIAKKIICHTHLPTLAFNEMN
jgi:hypothetical protein